VKIDFKLPFMLRKFFEAVNSLLKNINFKTFLVDLINVNNIIYKDKITSS